MPVNKNRHSFHLVDVSPWPFVASTSVFMITTASAMSMHNYSGGTFLLKCGFGLLLFTMFVWWRDIIREGTYEGQHTNSVQMGLKLGIILFIISEIMFFFGFFWAFFHSSFNPSPVLGGVWPPINLSILNPWQVPLLNTILLLSSGVSVTWAHHALVLGNKKETTYALITTIVLALIFTLLQAFEYITAPFSISDSVYGSTFFMATGFHGFHVLIGTIFLFVCLLRLLCSHFTVEHHVGFEAAAWYWHFVDVVWLFLFITLYWWGGL